jgi:hypothetical protein
MARRTVVSVPERNYNANEFIGEIDLLSTDRGFGFELARYTAATPTIWPNVDTILEIYAELSVDGGATWESAGSCTMSGGPQYRWGEEVATSRFHARVRSAPQRRLRINVTIVNGPLRTSGSVWLED